MRMMLAGLLAIAGCTGDAGKDGRDGRDGADGAVGEQGERGDPGPTGEQGPMGEQGQEGPQGTPGVPVGAPYLIATDVDLIAGEPTGRAEATCSAGDLLIGGGCTASTGARLFENTPSTTCDNGPWCWVCGASPAAIDTVLTARALCLGP